ncbi:chemotaxis protein [Erythrobacter longus]|uniref:protein-glutamate methylesterase n=1 Tax=Erythrobacter longus TaxID=1044 RepID=A0A074M9W5_ERYLO|nr:chemotaxis-specific protein-glutamate methyltransferase CheB [Erythrobacter longus]KEO90204.1 chemotaxis protein [Erythrobacter longus]
MIVDDSLTVRTIFRRMVEGDPSMEIAGTASSAERAIAQIKKEPADVVLLDLEMPGIGGLKALPDLLAAAPGVQVLVVSSLTQDGAEATVEALSNGAADTLQKPRPGGFTEDYRSQLLSKIRALGSDGTDAASSAEQMGALAGTALDAQATSGSITPALKTPRLKRPDVIAIGASTGGIHAINLMLRELSPSCTLPILITQHLPSNFIPVFARQIEVASGRPTKIAEDGTEIRGGEIAIATGHGHMRVSRLSDRLVARTSAEPAVSGCLPSVDPMLKSLAEACEGRVLAIILSGMGRDGFHGAQSLVEAGGSIWAQSAETCAVWGMPGAVTKAGLTSFVATPQGLGQAIMARLADKAVPRGGVPAA